MAGADEADILRFYDNFAADYHLTYGGKWESAVERQATALDRLIRDVLPDARSVLDCSCGIGTMAMAMAMAMDVQVSGRHAGQSRPGT